jgi:hypothetical protein
VAFYEGAGIYVYPFPSDWSLDLRAKTFEILQDLGFSPVLGTKPDGDTFIRILW